MKYKTFICRSCLGLAMMGSLVVTGCTDLLDVERHGATNTSLFYQTAQEAEEALAALYGCMASYDWNTGENIDTNLLSDDCYAGGGSRGDNAPLEELNELRFSPTNHQNKEMYRIYYEALYRANLVINYVDEDASEVHKRCVAEARALRGFVFLRLASFFGECPIITEIIELGNYQRPNNSHAELFAQAEQDLQDAINSGVMYEKAHVDDRQAHVTKQFAQAVLGKCYVYESTYLNVDKWEQAREALTAVISSNKYKLYEGNYNDMWHEVGRFSCESIFETNCARDQQNMISTWGYALHGWRMDKFNQSQLIVANEMGADISGEKAWGFMNPSKELYDAFVEEEGEDGYRLNQTITTYKQLCEYPLTLPSGSNVYGNAGYFEKKGAPRKSDEVSASSMLWAKNQVIMRYAEVLLLAAEAELPQHGGTQSLVDTYMDMIRERARVANRPGNYTLEDIQKEKRLELCFENTRFPDLVRWGLAASVLKDKGKRIPSLYGLADGNESSDGEYVNENGYLIRYIETSSQGFISNKHEFMPIPQDELNVNPYATQHTGW